MADFLNKFKESRTEIGVTSFHITVSMKKNHTPKFIITAVAILGLLFISLPSKTNTGGPPASYTNAPITSTTQEANCTSCHPGTLQTSGTNYNNISFNGNFTGGGYIPDSTYTLTLSYTHSGKSKFGYQLTCLDDNNGMAGSFATLTGNNKSSMVSGTVGGGVRQYMRHTSAGTVGTGGSASWSFSWTAPSNNVGDVTIYAVVNSTNSSGTGGDIIIAREFDISPSTLLPVATAGVTNATVCQGALANFTGSATNSPTSWNWSTTGGSPTLSTTQNPSVRYNFPGNYRAILTATNSKGISLPDTVYITVIPSPGPSISGGATQSICQGDSILLSSALQSGVTYSWNNGATGNEIWVKNVGNYFVTATGANGCSRVSNSVDVAFYPQPIAGLTSSASLYNDSSCTNSSLVLEATTTDFDSFYFYEDGALLAATTDTTYTLTFDGTATYGLQVLNSNSCKSDMVTLVINEKQQGDAPVLDCTASTPSSITFAWTSLSAHQGYEVTTNGGASWQSPSSGILGNTHVVSGLQPQDSVELWVRSIQAAPCTYSLIGSKKCASQPCTQLDASVQAPSSVCKGDLWRVEINGLSEDNYSLSLDGGAPFTDTIFSFNPTSSRTYLLRILDSNNLVCPPREIEISVEVDVIFDIALKADKLGAYCVGEDITYTANDSIENFDFYLNNNLVQSGASNSYSNTMLNNNDSIYVIVSKGQCTDTSEYEYVNREIESNAGFTYTRSHTEYTLTPEVNNYSIYRWNFGDGSATSNDVSPVHDYGTSAGETLNVTLEVETVNGCVKDSSESLSLPDFAGLELLRSLGVSVYPNPAVSQLTISNASGKTMGYTLTNRAGKEVKTANLIGVTARLDFADLSAGVYLLKCAVDGKTTTIRVVKN